MASIKLYTAIFVGLTIISTIQAAFEFSGVIDPTNVDATYWAAFGVLLTLSFIKAALVAGYFQHLKMEPRSITYVYLTGLLAALALTLAASYSIT